MKKNNSIHRMPSKKVPTISKAINKLLHKYESDSDVDTNRGVLNMNILVPMQITIPLRYITSKDNDKLINIQEMVKQLEIDYRYYTTMDKKIENIEKETPIPENQYKYFQQLLNPSTNFYKKNISLESSMDMLNPYTAFKEYQKENNSLLDRKFTVSESLFITYWISKGMPQIIDLDDAMKELNKSQSNISTIVFSINKKLKSILKKDLKIDIDKDIIFLSESSNPLNKFPISITNTYKDSYGKKKRDKKRTEEKEEDQ